MKYFLIIVFFVFFIFEIGTSLVKILLLISDISLKIKILSNNYEKMKLFYAIRNCSKNKNVFFENMKGILIKPYGRFGNNFIQFVRIIQYTFLLGWNEILIPYNFLLLRKNFQIKNIIIRITKFQKSSYHNYVYGCFYFPFKNNHVAINYSYHHLFKTEVLKSIPNISLNKNDLYLHIRSGDILRSRRHISYFQPPINYYIDIINFKKWNKIHLISEDNKSFILQQLIHKAEQYTKQSFMSDLTLLINCYNLGISRSTFCIASSFLSRNLNFLFTFNFPSNHLPSHYNCQPDASYIKTILNHWIANNTTNKLLSVSKCEKWLYFSFNISKNSKKKDFFNDIQYENWFF